MKSLYKIAPILLIISAFAPYLGGGVKYEDIVVYALVGLMLLLVLNSKTIRINKSVLGLFVIWVGIFTYMILRALIGGGSTSTQSLLADVNNLMQPLAILTLSLILINRVNKEDTIQTIIKAGKVFLTLLSLNSLWILIGFTIDTTAINVLFWGSAESTAANAAQNGRFSGIFNQPIEAGMAYATGLLVWLYLVERKHMGLGFISIIGLMLLFLGGSISVSKVFVLLGVGLFFVGAFFNKRVRRRILPMSLLFYAIGYPLYKYLSDNWFGLDYLLRLFDTSNYQQQGFMHMITAGRYGSDDSQQSSFFQSIWDTSPIIGSGLGSQETYDSAHFYFFSTGGTIGLLGYLILIAAFLWLVYEFRHYDRTSPEFKLFVGLVVLMIVGGLGAPAVTLNRSSLVMWVLIGLLLRYLCAVKMIRSGRLEEQPNLQPIKRKRRRFKRYRLTW